MIGYSKISQLGEAMMIACSTIAQTYEAM